MVPPAHLAIREETDTTVNLAKEEILDLTVKRVLLAKEVRENIKLKKKKG